jgi:cytochrome d ubiquinol oxidase subunit I
MSDFSALVSNPNIWYQFPHTILAGFTTSAFFVMGISAYHLLRKNEPEIFRPSYKLAVVVGAIATVLVAVNGHSQAQHMVRTQPMKMAAAEALWNSQDPASLSLFTIGNMEERKDVFAIRIPRLLSLLAYNQLTGEVKGINDLQTEYEVKYGPGDYVPPAIVTYWAFRIMVGAGLIMIGLALYALYIVMIKANELNPLALRIFTWVIALPYFATPSGWLLTEVGRFPWVVFGLIKLNDAVSPNVSAGMIWISLIGYILVYGILILATIYLLSKYARTGLAANSNMASVDEIPSSVVSQGKGV